jgi:hypothetical protein
VKKIILILIMVLLTGVMSGCVTTPEQQEVFTEIAARRLAQHIAQTHPELVIPGTLICDQILGTDNKITAQELLDKAIDQAIGKIAGGDPLLAKDIKSIIKLLNVDLTGDWLNAIGIDAEIGVDTSDFDMKNLKIVAQAVKDGLNMPMFHYVEAE